MPYNLIFIDESESMQRAVATIFLNNPDFKLELVGEPSFLYKTARNFIPDIIVLSYNTIDTELKKSITEIKTSSEFLNTPLVLLVPSDLSDNERESLLKLKTDGFIYRPFDKDAFISKIKRTLSENHAAARTVENAENSENPEEKIYDISLFETKKIPPSDSALSIPSVLSVPAAPSIPSVLSVPAAPSIPAAISAPSIPAANADLTGLPVSAFEYQISGTEPEPSVADIYADNIPADVALEDNIPAEGNEEKPADGLESSELSQAFENLFKDDAIFKEFQDINQKEVADAIGYLPEEKPLEAIELKPVANINTEKSEGELNLKILDEQNLVKLDDYLKNALEKTFEEIKPQIIETIKNSLPEIIERLVKEEIEKIKQQ